MTRSQANDRVDFCQVMVESYAVNERMNQIILEQLDPAAWRAQLHGSKGRTIAGIVAHVRIIAARYACWRTNSDFPCRARPRLQCGAGKDSGRNADSRTQDNPGPSKKNISKEGAAERADLSTTLRSDRDDKGEVGASGGQELLNESRFHHFSWAEGT